MRVGELRAPESEATANPVDDKSDEKRRLSVFDLVGMAAGGVIGSGWLLAAVKADDTAGFGAVWSWAIGGALMLVIAVVMVELGTAAPRTGGLVFLPLQSSGPLVATIVAAALWIFYAINTASEAAAMTKGLSFWRSGLSYPSDPGDPSQYTLTHTGLFCAALFMAVITVLNLLAQQLLVKVNFLLTVWKVAVPVLVVVLLIASGFDHHGPTTRPDTHGHGVGAVLAAVVSSGVIFAYMGFQAPLDFAGSVRRRGIGRPARIRWAVYGTVVGSLILYVLLQIVFSTHRSQWLPGSADSPYTQFAIAASIGWIVPLLRVNALLSPMGAGVVFAHGLTREVAALSRAHLTHRGLQTATNASISLGRRHYDVYWAVLLVDFVIAWIMLVVCGGSWGTLAAISGVLGLVIYVMPGVVLVSLRKHLAEGQIGATARVLAPVGFVAIALVLYWAGWESLWKGMAALAIGIVLLLGLPVLARWDLPVVGRLLRQYDAKEHADLLRTVRDPQAACAASLTGYLAVLTLLTLMGNSPVALLPKSVGSVVVGVAALLAFWHLVALSKAYMEKEKPKLPAPLETALPRATAGK